MSVDVTQKPTYTWDDVDTHPGFNTPTIHVSGGGYTYNQSFFTTGMTTIRAMHANHKTSPTKMKVTVSCYAVGGAVALAMSILGGVGLALFGVHCHHDLGPIVVGVVWWTGTSGALGVLLIMCAHTKRKSWKEHKPLIEADKKNEKYEKLNFLLQEHARELEEQAQSLRSQTDQLNALKG